MKPLASFLIGVGVGIVGAYVYFNNKLDEIVDKKVNEQMIEFFKHQEQTMTAEDVEIVSEEQPNETAKESEKPETQEKTSIEKMENIIRTNYRDVEKEPNHGNDGIEEDEDDEEDYITDEEMEELMAEAQNRMAEQPHIITEEEANTTLIGYDNEEYIWYPKENFITDALDNRIEEQDFLDMMLKPIDWRKELKDKDKIIVRVYSEATNYTVWNHDKAGW